MLIDCRMKANIKEKIKTGISVLIILILLPYVAAVFRTGSMGGIERQEQEMDLEYFVAEILPAQMPVSYEEEALKAQAVIIRTNLLRQAAAYYGSETASQAAESIKESDLEALGFDFYTREEQIRLWGYESWEQYAEKCGRAVEATRGQVLVQSGAETAADAPEAASVPETVVQAGDLLDLPYHAVSAGSTRDGSVLGEAYAWLEAVECPGDLQASDYLKIETLDLPALPEILSRDDAGYATQVRMGETIYGGEEFRSLYGLNSSCFTAEQTEEGVRIVTKGLGHGLGLSMYQANLQALDGKQYQEILYYFYKNAECISFS